MASLRGVTAHTRMWEQTNTLSNFGACRNFTTLVSRVCEICHTD